MASVSGPNGTPERTEQGPLTSCLVSGPGILGGFGWHRICPQGPFLCPPTSLASAPRFSERKAPGFPALGGPAQPSGFSSRSQRLAKTVSPAPIQGPGACSLSPRHSSETPGRESVSTEALSTRSPKGSSEPSRRAVVAGEGCRTQGPWQGPSGACVPTSVPHLGSRRQPRQTLSEGPALLDKTSEATITMLLLGEGRSEPRGFVSPAKAAQARR